MQGVDEVGVEELPDGGSPAAEPDVLALRGLPGLFEDRGVRLPSVKWSVVSERVNGGRLWWVRRNTGVRNGGAWPHRRCHWWLCQGLRWGPDSLRPVISASMLRA